MSSSHSSNSETNSFISTCSTYNTISDPEQDPHSRRYLAPTTITELFNYDNERRLQVKVTNVLEKYEHTEIDALWHYKVTIADGTSFAYAILQCTDENLFEEEEDMAWVEDTYVAVWKSKFISYDCENVPILRFINFQVYTLIDGIQEVT